MTCRKILTLTSSAFATTINKKPEGSILYNMHYRRLGRSGLKISEISLGAWVTMGSQIDEKVSKELILHAFENGVNFFDNADIYARGQAELVMGAAIKDLPR